MDSVSFQLGNLGAAQLPHLDQYFGLWSISPQHFQATIQAIGHIDMQSHMALGTRTVADAPLFDVTEDGVGLVQIVGTMTKYGSSFSTMGSTIRARQAVREANRDDSVRSILLRLESPGGTVAGTAELADAVRESGKPVTAFVDDLTASAAYYVASQAKQIVANRPALIGSIGTYATVVDMSKAADQAGIKVHLLTTGPLKGAGTPGTEITDQQLAHFQSIIDKTNRMFLDAVKSGRRMDDKKLSTVSTGAVWLADDARALGLIDSLGTFESAFEAAASLAPQSTKPKGVRSMSAHIEMRELINQIQKEKSCDRAKAVRLARQQRPDLFEKTSVEAAARRDGYGNAVRSA